ncbi:Enoyl-(Acyl carrier protein) reductase [Ceratobasidium sp. AG-Ba]|nr:Enoyl-(Acyl carrier protein) reductase [Ceratobasidium sp. AG-Ba]QRW07415.1 Enoyl-(Acyl carrier protein) reductase [Ceratobasidium sp. AG-Ba]
MDLGLDGVHVLVTGASGGIGFETTKHFLDHGACVTAHYNTGPGPLKDLEKTADNLKLVQADVTEEKMVEHLFEQAGRAFGTEVEVLVVNHGIFLPEDVQLVDMGIEQWKRTLDVNLTGPFLLVREFLRRIREPREYYVPNLSKISVVAVGSTSGEFGEAGHIDYACSKAALQSGFIRTVKNEIVKIAPMGRINAVSPGWVLTAMAQRILADPMVFQREIATTPLKKVANVTEIASQILFLASSKVSGHITGQNVVVAGGMEGSLLNMPTASEG